MVQISVVLKKLPDGRAEVYACGGTILRKNLILTAAHCQLRRVDCIIANSLKRFPFTFQGNTNETDSKPYSPESYFVNVGTNNNDLTGGTLHYVKTVFVHPKYKGGGDNHFFHDVGLLELTNDIELNDRSQLVKLAHCSDRPFSGDDLTISGYGKNPDHPNDKRLYQVHLKVITAQKCVDELAGGTVEEVDKHQICAAAKGKNQCKGDSGGKLIMRTIRWQRRIIDS